MTQIVWGQLEIDSERGVIYFHANHNGASLLRVCGVRFPALYNAFETQVDITLPRVGFSGLESKP